MKSETLQKYITGAKVRFTKRAKLDYAQILLKDYEALGYQGMVKSARKGITSIVNVMVGNFKTAKKVIVVPYDTPSKVFWKNYKYYAQDGDHALKKNFIPIYTPMIIAYMVLLLMVYGLPMVLSESLQSWVFSFSSLYLIGVLILIIRGYANTHNTVRNNASLAVAYEYASSLSKEERKDVAFVFTGSNTSRMYGSLMLQEYLDEHNRKPLLIVLYCLGRGSLLSVAYDKGERKTALELTRHYEGNSQVKAMDNAKKMQTPMEAFQGALMVSSGDIVDDYFCVMNTCSSKDKEYDESLLDNVVSMLLKFK